MLKNTAAKFAAGAKTAVFMHLLLLYALNICDYICTVVLLNTGKFGEANPVMSFLFRSPFSAFAVKCILPALLLAFVCLHIDRIDEKRQKTAVRLTDAANFIYLAIIFIHIINFLLLFFAV